MKYYWKLQSESKETIETSNSTFPIPNYNVNVQCFAHEVGSNLISPSSEWFVIDWTKDETSE